MAKKKQHQEPVTRRQRRTIDQQIADLAAKIENLKVREARKQAKADPVLRHANAALKAIEKGLAQAEDAETKHALLTARSTLAALVGGSATPAPGRAKSSVRVDEATLFAHVRSNPGQRGEEIASALATDAGTLRPVMKKLIASGKVTTEGQRRGMTYSAV
jgi:hypothetical protein